MHEAPNYTSKTGCQTRGLHIDDGECGPSRWREQTQIYTKSKGFELHIDDGGPDRYTSAEVYQVCSATADFKHYILRIPRINID